jgi:ribose transport system ATP-binding protein
MMVTEPAALEVHGIGKAFGGNWVLQDIDFSVRPGEVLGLVGENGSGKSTLVKILSGVHTPDSGSVRVGQEELSWPFNHPQNKGIAVIHQDLGLVDGMSVADNLGISSSYGARLFAPISSRQEARACKSLLDTFAIDVDLRTLVGSLTPAVRSAIGIARSARVLNSRTGSKVFILDEPTAYLGDRDANRVLRLIKTTASEGAAVIFISHHLDEVVKTCDRIIVLRDGRIASEFDRESANPKALIAAMLGQAMERFYPVAAGQSGEPLLKLTNLSGITARNVSFAVHAGEVLGVTGLVGSGYDEIPYLVGGIIKASGGSVYLDDKLINGFGIRQLLDLGISIVPGNRQRDSAWMEGSARENISLLKLRSFFRWPSLRRRAETKEAAVLMNRWAVRPHVLERPFSLFSGGNQQKIVLAKWLSTANRIMLLDEPTQGVDAGARREILDQIAKLAHAGNAVAIFSADTEQLSEMCDRIVIMVNGRVHTVLSGSEINEPRVIALTQSTDE